MNAEPEVFFNAYLGSSVFALRFGDFCCTFILMYFFDFLGSHFFSCCFFNFRLYFFFLFYRPGFWRGVFFVQPLIVMQFSNVVYYRVIQQAHEIHENWIENTVKPKLTIIFDHIFGVPDSIFVTWRYLWATISVSTTPQAKGVFLMNRFDCILNMIFSMILPIWDS